MSHDQFLMDINHEEIKENIRIRKARAEDVHGILRIASTVGKGKKNPRQGFLMDDYTKDIAHHRKKMLRNILEIEHFYVAEYHEVLGFLIAYTKEKWLKYNEDWMDVIYWHPDFNKSKLDNFILIDKTAIHSELTGMGIGSKIYKTLLKDIKAKGVKDILAETLIAPVPNFASLEFRIKQNYNLCGFRYEKYAERTLSTLVYHKEI